MTGPWVRRVPGGIWCGSHFFTISCQKSHLRWIWYESLWYRITVNLLCPRVLGSQTWGSRGFWVLVLGTIFPPCQKIVDNHMVIGWIIIVEIYVNHFIFKVCKTSSYQLRLLVFCLITQPYSPYSQPGTEPTYMDGKEIPEIYYFAIF